LGKTIVEKIMAKAAGKQEVFPGEYLKFGIKDTFIQVVVTLDQEQLRLLLNSAGIGCGIQQSDNCTGHCGSYSRARDKVTNRESHRLNSEWARKMGVPEENILELGRIGNCHHIAIEKAWALPGGVYLHTDTHCPTVGGVGCFGVNLSAAETSFLRTGWMWFRVPKSIKFNLTGKLQDGIMGRDVFEYILSQIGPDGAIYKVMEFTGPVMDEMSMDGVCQCVAYLFLPGEAGHCQPRPENNKLV